MTDSDVNSKTYSLKSLSVGKRVHYVLGQVLGLDDFCDEQKYHMDIDRRQNRSLHGYGTVWGLAVTAEIDGDGQTQIHVSPGFAIDPAGRGIDVPSMQCANLNEWVASDHETLQVDEDGNALAYVTLCYTLCNTDEKPIAGKPCRHENDAIKATRVQDDYRLDFVATPPAQPEEVMIRAFGRFIEFFEIVPEEEVEGDLDLQDLLNALKPITDACKDKSDEEFKDEMLSLIETLTGDAEKDTFSIPLGAAREFFRDFFGYWVTRSRAGADPEDSCVLLAVIKMKLQDGQLAEGPLPEIDDSRRPYLLHTRMMQEWLLGGRGIKGVGDVEGIPGPPGRDGEPGEQGIPGEKGDTGPGLTQVIITPNMMTPTIPLYEPSNVIYAVDLGRDLGIVVPQLGLLNGVYPAWIISSKEQAVTFCWGRPQTIPQGTEKMMNLRLYWSVIPPRENEFRVPWKVEWRWVGAIKPGEGQDAPLTELGDLFPASVEDEFLPGVQYAVMPGGDEKFHLAVTPTFTIAPSESEVSMVGDYLLVRISVPDFDGEAKLVHLMLAELSWREG
jgi:hypothetical protein